MEAMFGRHKTQMVSEDEALSGRPAEMAVPHEAVPVQPVDLFVSGDTGNPGSGGAEP